VLCFLLLLLLALYFPLKEPPPLTGFTLLNKIDLSKCTETDERHFPHIDITLLHKFLVTLLVSLSSFKTSQLFSFLTKYMNFGFCFYVQLLALKTSERESIVSGNQQQSQLKQEVQILLHPALLHLLFNSSKEILIFIDYFVLVCLFCHAIFLD
jgi:hypothetical protein